jgi:glucoamylase
MPTSEPPWSEPDTADAPGRPGIAPTWTSSAKDAVGCSLGPSRLWFTTGFGIVNEVYYPRIDIPQIRDLGFIVADGKGFWSEVKRLENYRVNFVAPGVAAFDICHEHSRYRLHLRISPDPRRDVLALEGDEDLRAYGLLAPPARLNRSSRSRIAPCVCGAAALWDGLDIGHHGPHLRWQNEGGTAQSNLRGIAICEWTN